MHSNEGDFLNLKKLKWGNFVHFQKNTEKGSSLLIFKKNIEVTAGPTKETVRSSPTSTLKCEPLTPKIYPTRRDLTRLKRETQSRKPMCVPYLGARTRISCLSNLRKLNF